MTLSRRRFLVWFAVLLASFALANLSGVIRQHEFKPPERTGFPLIAATWDDGSPVAFDVPALLANVAVAVFASAAVACLCALRRKNTSAA